MKISNTDVLKGELAWLDGVINFWYRHALEQFKNGNGERKQESQLMVACAPPEPIHGNGNYSDFLADLKPDFEERLLLVTAMAIHLDPYFFSVRQSRLDRLDKHGGPMVFGVEMMKGCNSSSRR